MGVFLDEDDPNLSNLDSNLQQTHLDPTIFKYSQGGYNLLFPIKDQSFPLKS